MRAGGAATGGGMNYQTAVTTLIAVHIATGRRISWADSLLPEVPLSLSAETNGSGDDIRVNFGSGYHAEIQVKKGLKRDNKLWSALESLANGIERNSNEIGILVVCEATSNPIKKDLRRDIERIGDGRMDGLKEISQDFIGKLTQLRLSPEKICARLRIFVVDAADISSHRIQIALRDLEKICPNRNDALKVWDTLYLDCARLIEIRGRRDIVSIGRTLRNAGVSLKQDAGEPAAILSAICQFNIQTNAELTIPGYHKTLPIEDVWISTRVKRRQVTSHEVADGFIDALSQYHKSTEAKQSESTFDIEWLGRFVKHVVVIGGPGAGKTTAAKMLARRYSLDGFPVLKVRLPQIVKRLESGDGIWDALVSLGIDGSGVQAANVSIQFPSVIIADGLDECGAKKSELSEKLANLAKNHPHLKIIVTSRPIGYDAPAFATWCHYRMLAQDEIQAGTSLKQLVEDLSDGKIKLEDRFDKLANIDSNLSEAIRSTPLVLTLSAVLLAEGQPLAKTKAGQYAAIMKRIEENNKPRADHGGLSDPILKQVLNSIGEHLIASPLSTTAQTTASAVSILSLNLGVNKLQSEDMVDRAISYWKEIGILEAITFKNDEYLSFIHRSFAEFVSARYLIEKVTRPDAIDKVIRERISDDKWSEVIEFAGYLEWNDAIVGYLTSEFSLTSINAISIAKALKIAAFSNQNLKNASWSRLIDLALQLSQTGRRDIISILAKHTITAVDRYPSAADDIRNKLIKSEKPWTRLLGWAVLLGRQYNAAVTYEARGDLPILIETILNDRDRNTTGIINVDISPDTLIEVFSVRLIDALSAELQEKEFAEAISPIVDLSGKLSIGFSIAIRACLQRHGVDKSFKKTSLERASERMYNSGKFAKALRENLLKILEPLLELLTSENLSKLKLCKDEKYIQMSAVLQITDFWLMPISKIIIATDDELAAAEQEVMRGLLDATQIDLVKLASEIMVFKERIEQQPDADFMLFNQLVHVDCDLPTWSVNLFPPLDINQLAKSLCESSPWIARVSTALIYANADNLKLEQVVKQALDHKSHSSLSLASHLAKKLPDDKAIPMLLEIAKDYECDVSPVLDTLAANMTWGPQIADVIEGHLLRSNVDNAIAATDFLLSLVPEISTETIAMARRAYEYWHKNEDPYPVNGGVIPRTPRDKLIELVDIGQWSDEKLFEAVDDPRSDVRKQAIEKLIGAFDGRIDLQAEFVKRCSKNMLSLNALREILRGDPNLNPEQAIQLGKYLLNHDDRKWRYVGLGVLELKCVTNQQKKEFLGKLNQNEPVEIIARIERIRANMKLLSVE